MKSNSNLVLPFALVDAPAARFEPMTPEQALLRQ